MSHKVKVAIFGGSFDPFHKGHKNIIESLIQLEKFDEIIVMPLGLAPHKNGYMTPAGYRYEMTRLAVLDLPEITLSDYEINRPGKYSYTVDTIKYFKQKIKLDYLMNKHKKIKKKRKKYLKKHPRSIKKNYKFNKQILDDISDTNLDVRISLVYGSDALDTIESWHEPAELMKSATLWICRRGRESTEHMERRAAYLKKKYQATIKFFDITETEFSGTEIRQHLIQDKKQKNKLPDPVWKFIYQNKIYLLQDSMKKLGKNNLVQLAIYENELRKNVSRSRFIHSLNVMQYAVHLADIHNYDLMKAATTGILHDIAKAMNIKKQYKLANKMGKLEPLNKNIAHGPAGAFYISKELRIQDSDIIDALTFHTTARANMTTLDKIIFLADKLEYGREFKNLEPIREKAKSDLNEAMKICLEEVQKALDRKSKEGHPSTQAATDYLKDL